MIYLDNAATTFIKPQSVERAVINAMRLCSSHGRGAYEPAVKAAETVFKCREEAAELFNVPDVERVVFTMNATHALNIAIKSLASKGTKVLISGYEHNSVTRPLAEIGAAVDTAVSAPFDSDAMLAEFKAKLDGKQLAVCTHVSNVFGFILPIYEIAEECRRRGVPLIIDASQSAGVLNVDQKELNAAFIAMPGHKALFGPQGTGILICGTEGKPLISGGSGSDSLLQTMPEYLPDRLEAGTHNVPGIAGLAEGIRYVRRLGTDTVLRHERKLIQLLRSELESNKDIELFCGEAETQLGVLSFRHRRFNCEEIARRLAAQGICVRSGLHCAPLAHKSAGTLETGTVRVSVSPFVSEDSLKKFCRSLEDLS